MTKTPLLLIALAAIALLASIPLLFAPDAVWLALVSVIVLLAIAAVALPDQHAAQRAAAATAVGVGTVRAVNEYGAGTDADVITIDVENVSGQAFTGRLRHTDGDVRAAALRPGTVLLVTFDPLAREQLSLADDIDSVRAAFDRMLVTKGLLTTTQLDLIRCGVKTHAVVTGARATGIAREDHREVVVDLMVTRAGGGQFPAHETTLIPADSLLHVAPGNVVDVYYRDGDESTVAVCVAPSR